MRFPSTTEILKRFGLMDNYDDFGSVESMLRGTRVGHATNLIDLGQSLGDGWEERHPECSPYLEAYRKFRREHRFKLMEFEPEYLCTTYRFVSHPDKVGLLDKFGLVNLELKTGSLPNWIYLQTAGQVLAIGHPAMQRFALLLKANGSYQLEQHTDYRDVDRFRAFVDVYWSLKELRGE